MVIAVNSGLKWKYLRLLHIAAAYAHDQSCILVNPALTHTDNFRSNTVFNSLICAWATLIRCENHVKTRRVVHQVLLPAARAASVIGVLGL